MWILRQWEDKSYHWIYLVDEVTLATLKEEVARINKEVYPF